MATTDQAPPPTDAKAKKRGKAKPRDPNRVPVKRERSEMYRLVSFMDRARKDRSELVRRIEAAAGLQAKLREMDAAMGRYGERMRALMALMDGDGVAESAAPKTPEA